MPVCMHRPLKNVVLGDIATELAIAGCPGGVRRRRTSPQVLRLGFPSCGTMPQLG